MNTEKQEVIFHRSIGGEYQIEKLNSEGKVIFQSKWHKNLITDYYLNLLMTSTGNEHPRYCRVGTGTTVPNPSDVALENQIALSEQASAMGQNDLPTVVAGTPVKIYWTTTYNFGLGGVVGNITEVGVSLSASGSLVSRTLFKDGLGNPTSITVLSDEQLRIQYRMYIEVPSTDATGTVNGYDFIARPYLSESSNARQRWSPFQGIASSLSFTGAQWFSGDIVSSQTVSLSNVITGSNPTTFTQAAYVPGSFETEYTLYWDTSAANNTLRTLKIFDSSGSSYRANMFQIQFDPAIVKTNEDVLTIVVKATIGRA